MTTFTSSSIETKATSRSTVFTMTRKGGVVVVRLHGPRVGEREASIVSPQVREMIHQVGTGLKGLVLDLSGVKVMSSFGLGLCIELRNLTSSYRSATVLYGTCPEIRELFRIMKLDRLFTIALSDKQLPTPIEK